jgi:hypothetical protein
MFVSSYVTSHKILEDVHEDSIHFPSQINQFLCNRPDRPLKASGHPSVSRSFSVEDIRTSEQHRQDSRSSFSNFYTELDFSRHYLWSLCKTLGRSGNPSGCYPAFQNILSFLLRTWKWVTVKTVQTLGQAVWRGPIMGRIALFWKGSHRRPSGQG